LHIYISYNYVLYICIYLYNVHLDICQNWNSIIIYDNECTVAVYSLVIAFFTHKLLRCGSEYESPGDFSIFISDTFRSRKSVRRRVDFGLETLSVGYYSLQPAALLCYFYLAHSCTTDCYSEISRIDLILLLYSYPTVWLGVWVCKLVVVLFVGKIHKIICSLLLLSITWAIFRTAA